MGGVQRLRDSVVGTSFVGGPFFWTIGKQEVYYVTIRTADGQIKRGWVRCGNWFLGVLVDEAQVRWDE